MMSLSRRLRSQSGFSLIELVMVLAIVSIIYAILTISYDSFKARLRYTQVRADIDSIVKAAYNDMTSQANNDWAAMVMPGTGPSFVGKTISRWPTPPCPGWMYSWDNFFGVPSVQAVRLTVRHSDMSSIFSYCIENYGGNCQGDDGFGGTPPDIVTYPNHYIYCGE